MRPLLFAFAGMTALLAGLGCQHVAGKCDCVPPIQPCCIYGLYTSEHCPAPNAGKPGCSSCGGGAGPVTSAPAPVLPGTMVPRETLGMPLER